jgi:hypothetical protein
MKVAVATDVATANRRVLWYAVPEQQSKAVRREQQAALAACRLAQSAETDLAAAAARSLRPRSGAKGTREPLSGGSRS